MLRFQVSGQRLRRLDNEALATGSASFPDVHFDFSGAWTEGTKTAIFTDANGSVYNVLLNSDGTCKVPSECMTGSYFKLSLFNTNGDTRITTNEINVIVKYSGFVRGLAPADPTPTVYEQILESIDNIKTETKNDTVAIDAKVDEKLTGFEDTLDTERARIDAIASLPEGSTTADAELVDIRVGYEGTQYKNAGTAVREQIAGLKKEIDEKGVTDGSITEEKLSDELAAKVNSAGYVIGADGKKYSIAIDVNGNVSADRIYEISTDGLLCDIQIVDGAVVDTTGNVDTSGFVVTDDYFVGDSPMYGAARGTNIIDGHSLGSRTIIFLADLDEAHHTIFGNADTMYGLRWGKKATSNSDSFTTFSKILAPVQEFRNADNLAYDIYSKANITKDPLVISDYNDMFFVLSVDTENSKYFAGWNEFLGDEISYDYANYPALTSIRLFKGATNDIAKFKRVIIYDRALTKDEVNELREKIMLLYYTQWYNSTTFVQGMTGLGSPSAYQVRSSERVPEFIDTPIESGEQTITINGEDRTFINVDPTDPTIDDDMSYVEALYWLNPIESLNVGDMYNIEAMVYPYNITENSYNVEYVSSNPSVIECYYGVLIAKKAGSATITAKASGTEITCTLDITVSEVENVVENFFKVSEQFIYKGNQLIGGDGVNTLKAIVGAIEQASANGYNGVVFPKMDYHVKPYKKDVICYVPSDFTVDFNGSTLYVEDNDFCHSTNSRPDKSVNPYTMFSFSGFKVKGEDGNQIEDKYYMSCKNSVVKNLDYYGERRLMSDLGYTERDYGEQVKAFAFSSGAYNCKIENINFYDSVGFNIATTTNSFDQWSGTGLDGAVRGCVRYSDFILGKLDETGLTASENGDWYHTDFLKLGYNYSDNPTGSKDMKYYKVGKMDVATSYGLNTRWYDIYWFDENKNLIEYRTHQMTLESYLLPENAVYFKVNARFPSGAPTSSNEGKVDTPHVIRVWPSVDPDRCYIRNCKFYNPHASAISMTGGTNFVLSDIFAENGHSPLGVWSIDYEDGWQAMRHNINYRIICTGILTMPGGHNTATLHSVINTARSGPETEAVKYINCAIQTLQPSPKTNDLIANVTYGGDIKSYGQSSLKYQLKVARLREVNCIKNTAMNVI